MGHGFTILSKMSAIFLQYRTLFFIRRSYKRVSSCQREVQGDLAYYFRLRIVRSFEKIERLWTDQVQG